MQISIRAWEQGVQKRGGESDAGGEKVKEGSSGKGGPDGRKSDQIREGIRAPSEGGSATIARNSLKAGEQP